MQSDVNRHPRGEGDEEHPNPEERPREAKNDPEKTVQIGEDPGNLAADGADGADAGRS
jgi:hypothetical protein